MNKERFETFGNFIKDNEQIPNILNNYQTTVRLNEFNKQISDLKIKLAEKEKQLRAKIGNMKTNDFIKMCLQCGLMVDAKEKDNQDKISFAVEQLEKAKAEFHSIHTDRYLKLIDKEIDNQIKQLKGEK